jgi:HD domain
MSAIGTLAWARRSGGRLGFLDRMRLALQGVRLRALRRKQAGMTSPTFAFEPSDLRLPDTPAAKRAVAVVESLSEPFLVNHCLRTFCWANLLAKAHKVTHDCELLFVAAALHDLGLTPANRQGRQDEHCFTVTGARCASEAMRDVGWTAQRIEAMEEAILLHVNLVVPVDRGAEAHLLQAGAALDVVGTRIREIEGPGVGAVLARFPRMDFKAKFKATLAHECTIHPCSRIAFFTRRGLNGLIARAPFAS